MNGVTRQSKDKRTNWLPAPKAGPIKLAMRLYVPRENVRDGSWVQPALRLVSVEPVKGAAVALTTSTHELSNLF